MDGEELFRKRPATPKKAAPPPPAPHPRATKRTSKPVTKEPPMLAPSPATAAQPAASPPADPHAPPHKSEISNLKSPLPATLAGRQWTPEQLLGITTTGRSLLVSAAAGSGKTSVLAQRCAYLVCDAPVPCDVDELLVVTFTEAAAAEMKSRITDALRARAAESPSPRLDRQLALADQAQVSTLHSFCARLLRQHFHLVDLDPGFAVLEADEARLLRREVARRLFDTRYEFDAAGDFHRFIDAYGEGDDDRVLRQVLHAHDLLTSVADPPRWIARAHARIAEATPSRNQSPENRDSPGFGRTSAGPTAENRDSPGFSGGNGVRDSGSFAESELGAELIATIGKGLAAVRRRCDDAIAQLRGLGFPQYADYLSTVAATLGYWHQAFDDEGIDALAEVVKDVEWPRLPSIRGEVANKELAKSLVDAVRSEAKEGPWRDRLRFSVEQWQDGLARILPHAEVFLKLVEDFDAAYQQAKRASRSVDFADLERYALLVLQDSNAETGHLSPSPAARAFHRRFAHVLVDEYQDINEVQDAILTLVSRECVAQEPGTIPNFFCVGDVKQSIYRFRLAEPRRFLDRQEEYRSMGGHGEVIDLQANFRSRDPLLEAINSVFARLMTAEAADIEYDQTQRLHGQAGYPPADGPACFRGAP
ncbi:MAG: ATP-dependent deoxyribonuclease subunit, partial [Phycisphaerales bacterium]|nr:ATP-dependent deoxyribonuclease subunit [Phycisphaerales bacterium]